MIMYTPIPLEIIFEGMEDVKRDTMEEMVNGILMEVQPINQREARIVRIISPNPQDYLNSSIVPGQIITYHHFVEE